MKSEITYLAVDLELIKIFIRSLKQFAGLLTKLVEEREESIKKVR